MRLVSRLVLSHTLPVAVVACALVVVLLSLARVTSSLKEVRDAELGALGLEETIHRTAWAVEVAMRHGAERCKNGESSAVATSAIKQRLTELENLLASSGTSASETILTPIRGYVSLASRVVQADTCQFLLSTTTQRERELLDEKLTDAWISRMFDLHSATLRKDEEVRIASASALSGGIVLALIAFLTAAWLAQRIARTVASPLASLSSSARRVGQGDFTVEIAAEGPREVRELAAEMDAMRRRLSELESLKQGFLASVSHEMRTPLTKIREALGLLADGVGGKLADRQQRIVQIAQVACEREIRTVTTLLDLSRLRAGVPIQRNAGASVDEVCWSAVRDEEIEAREQGVNIEVDISGQAPPALLDTVLLERAIANVVRNAVSVSKKGQRVLVRRDILAEGPDGNHGPWAKITVKDEGPGIPSEIRDILFNAFVTQGLDSSPKRVGIGLGLALAREIARAHGGDIVASDGATKGAEFHIWLPLEAPASLTEANVPAS
ncbi:MAG: HAMP domain-containing histidine kinase [Polyangiaceae bacterium]|nr:HAMP domain-containing histidine kinase [Polyangiaceae bacterium]